MIEHIRCYDCNNIGTCPCDHCEADICGVDGEGEHIEDIDEKTINECTNFEGDTK